MGKGSDWTVNQELVLLNILKDKIVDGTIQDCSPHAAIWPSIVAQFIKTTGLIKTTAQSKSLGMTIHVLRHQCQLSPSSTLTTAPTTRSRSKWCLPLLYYHNIQFSFVFHYIHYSLQILQTHNLWPRSKMGKGSDWTVNQELVLLNILKDKIVDGTIQDCSPHAAIWPSIVAQFIKTTGLIKTTAQKKGLPNYELMCELFSASIATGKNHHASTTSLPNTDHERNTEDGRIGLGIDDSHDPRNIGVASTAQPLLTPRTSSGKRGVDSIFSVHHHSKRMKGKSVASDTNKMVFLKFVDAQDCRNDILE
ncbi:hypothetical protein CJ030_MR7G028096 [Morella rubra]|uniref:Myb/SANT-like domain-containing protein n=1 Tax=Morella rubra TaxID=262757 RepID=A0A6A1UZB0_9ROSI|nr:hypothetical protein CJ030_MR7G028096 [Morella rubra]